MQKLFTVLLTLTLLILTACGATEDTSEPAAATPTPIVLATPTPQPAPPTPTSAPIEPLTDSPPEEATTEPTPTSLLPPDNMVLIPEGEFSYGRDDSKPKNGLAGTMYLPAFEIDRFEVTNANYTIFVEETGYTTYAEQNQSRAWHDAATDKENHPAVYLNWADAQAFCEWLDKRLPTEFEWEKAARSDDGRIYPWGDEFDPERGNFKERGIRGTTAVGSFPEGASPYGVEDMAGNVREWTSSYFLPYESQTDDANRYFGEEFRIHRGGGWFDGEENEVLTTYNRNFGPPETSTNDDIGFRCVRDIQ